MVMRSSAQPRDARSLVNWTENTGCIARAETAYLARKDDLVGLGASTRDPFNALLEAPIEDAMIWTKKRLGMVSTQGIREAMKQAKKKRSKRASMLADLILTLDPYTHQGPPSRQTADVDVQIFSNRLMLSLVRLMMVTGLILLLFAPVLLLMTLKTPAQRIGVCFSSCSVFIVVVSVVFRPKAVEVIMAGAA